jgi:FtsP/CotA-like multicopper oxidase with cupredoxin domain
MRPGGGLFEQAITRRVLTLAVAERADIWLDFGAAQSGEEIALVAQPFAPMMFGGRGMPMMRGPGFLNGRTFDMEAVADDERVRLGTTEVWEFVNDSPMAHPMHVHNLQFRVIERNGAASAAGDAAGLSAGFTDEGLKDVVLVLPGQRVKVLMKFEDHTGLYLYHCHILEHEDMGMMRNYRVEEKRA